MGCGGGAAHPPGGPADLGSFVGPAEGPHPTGDAAAPADLAMAVAANASCASATPVADGTVVSGEDTTTAVDLLNTACSFSAQGAVLYYAATIPAGSRMTAHVIVTDGAFDPVVRLLDGCATATCAAVADSGVGGDDETLTFSNSAATPRAVILAVGNYDPSGGTFDLEVHFAALAPNALCTAGKPVVAGTPLVGEDTTSGGGPENTCLSYVSGGGLYYTTTIPARTQIAATVTPNGTRSWDPSIQLLSACGAADACLGSADVGYNDVPETLTYRNKSSSPVPVVLSVGSYTPGESGTFDLSLTSTALGPPPTNVTCAMAKTMTSGISYALQDASEGSDTLDGACLPSGLGTVLYYKVSIPANSKLAVTATPEDTWDAVVRVLSACAATPCLASADDGASGTAETATYKNTSSAAVTVYVAVGSYDASTTGAFTVQAQITALPPPPANVTCSAATAMTSGQTLASQDLSYGSATVTACLPNATGPTLFYKTSIPAGQRLIARATPTGAVWDPALRVLSSCGATSCLSSSDAGTGGAAEVVSYKNSGASAAAVTLGVSSTSSTTGTFDVSTWLKTAATNTSCAGAKAVVNGTALTVEDGESASGASTQCPASGTGKVLYYSASIPAGKKLSAKVTPLGYWDPVVRLVSGCSATTCLASQDTGVSGAAETLNYTNSGTTTQAVIFTVGAVSATTLAYDLKITIL